MYRDFVEVKEELTGLFCLQVDDTDESVGRLITSMSATIINLADNKLDHGEIGELCTTESNTTRGYFNNAGARAQTFHEDGIIQYLTFCI